MVALAALIGTGAAHAQSDIEELSARAADARKRGDYRTAAEAYDKIVELRPEMTAARVNLGLMLYLEHQDERAAVQFLSVLKADAGAFTANLFLGLTLLRLHRAAEAVAPLKRAEQRNPRDPQVQLALGQAYMSIRDYAHARGAYSNATIAAPESADAWYGLGMSYLELERSIVDKVRHGPAAWNRLLLAEALLEQRKYSESVKIWRELVELRPKLPCAYAGLGVAFLGSGEIQPSVSAFREEESGCLLATAGLAVASAALGQSADAISALERIWSADTNFVRLQFPGLLRHLSRDALDRFTSWTRNTVITDQALRQVMVACIEIARSGEPVRLDRNQNSRVPANADATQWYAAGRYGECESALKQHTGTLAPASLRLLVRCAFYTGDYVVVFSAAGRLHDLASTDPEAAYWQVKAATALAADSFLRAAAIDTKSAKAHVVLGDFYRQKQDFQAAVSEYTRALEVEPDSLAGHFGMAAACLQDAQLDCAVEHSRKALAVDPSDIESSFTLGAALATQGDLASARPHLEAVVKAHRGDLARAHALLAKVYAREDRLKDAISELQEAVKSPDPDGSYHYQLFGLYKRTGDEASARAALEQYERIRKSRN